MEEIRQSCLRTCIKSGGCSRSYTRRCTYGIAPARRWILYGPSEQSRWAPQLGQRSWHACMSIIICIRTWGTPFSCQQASTIRRDPLHITHAGRHGACGSGYPACVRTCARAAACGDRQSNAASPFQAPTEPHGPGLYAYRSLTGRFRGPSGCMGQDGVPGRQGSRPPMPFPLSLRSRRLCLPVQPFCMVAVP